MRIAFLIVVSLHALIHLLGFLKGFEIKEIKELSLDISKPLALLWLASALLLVLYALLFYTHSNLSWLIGLAAVIVSQVLIILFWADAKFGTLPNLLILAVVIPSFASYQFQESVNREAKELLEQNVKTNNKVVSEDDLVDLPLPVQKWIRQSGMIGKPFISYARVTQEAEMKMKPDQAEWLQANALQLTTIYKPAFIWTTHVKMNSLVYFLGRDMFEEGKGEMRIKVNALLNVVNERGGKMDEGSLQRYLGEMVWFPSLALSPYITWKVIDENTAKATMTYKGTTGSGLFYFDNDGRFIKFSALRYMGNDLNAERHEWVLRVDDYNTFEGITIPSKMTATWKLDDGDWTWLKLKLTDVKYNGNTSFEL